MSVVCTRGCYLTEAPSAQTSARFLACLLAWGLGFRVAGFRFRVLGLGGFRLQVLGLGFRVAGFSV